MMKAVLKILLVITAFKAGVVLFFLTGAIIAWINGAPNILLPGLGLIVSMQLIVILLFLTELFLIAVAVFLWRFISKTRLR